MDRRLVLGCGTVGHDVIEWAVDQPGRLHVITSDPSRVDVLRDDSVRAVEADPTEPAVYPDSADVVVVAGDDPERNRVAAEAARARYPDALLFAYTGEGADAESKAAIGAVADRVLDLEHAVGDRVLDVATGDAAVRMQKLRRVLWSLDGPLAVVAHDNPDPDALASAVALVRLAEDAGVDADACYFGEISHQENRALVNLLDLDLRDLDPDETLDDYAGIALVDHSRPGVNDGLSEDTKVDIVVDHHPPRAPVEARFVDLRSDAGATSTLLTDYLERFGVAPDRTTATALLYGIRIDTKDFTREASSMDFEAAAYLLSTADESVLERVETPSMSAEVLETLAKAIRNRDLRDSALATGVGRIRDRDALAQAADRLLDMEGVSATLVYGFKNGTVYVSARARGTGLDLGETLRDAFDAIGSAGGHADMAGAQIPLGILADVDEGSAESLAEVVRDIVSERFFETLKDAPQTPPGDLGTDLAYELPGDGVDDSDPSSAGESATSGGDGAGLSALERAEGDESGDDEEERT
ncbi:DHH family phosphoesterase [Halobium salinum]|uniref:DHH family phosphoesterase n=1 Tax=Halobium salinum TaxID=1364940 RepID=A0ABD5PGP0_9EURY|nr:DHH family phosphoesterase [Halobium salinum]